MLSTTIRLLIFATAITAASECLAITLSDAAAMPLGSEVTIDQAVVINVTRLSVQGISVIQVRDDSRAVTLYPPPSEFLTGLQNGDVISFSGTTLQFYGQFELTPSAEPAAIVSSPTINTSLEPIPVTQLDFQDLSPTAEGLESRYVELPGIEMFFMSSNNTIPSGPPYTVGRSVAGESFLPNTTYIARDSGGNETVVWVRSQESVDGLNAYFGTIPAGPFDLPGIFMQFSHRDDLLPGITGVNYHLNAVVVGMPGDLNYDGFIGIEDLSLILANWNESRLPPDSLPGDVTHDDFVGIEDLNLVLANWNAGTPPAVQALDTVPEPGTGLAVLTLVLCTVSTRRL